MNFIHKLASTGALVMATNSLDAFVPEEWANESLAILMENMVIANLVHRDFSPLLSNYGDVVNTRRPSEFTMSRKGVNDSIVLQDASATNVQVALNQQPYVSFIIKDREQALSFKDLVATYLEPAVLALARGIDQILLSQAPRFLPTTTNVSGTLGTDASVASILATRRYLNDQKAPLSNRKFIISSKDETALLSLDTFINADKVGDDGTALREASLGRRLGFDFYMCQNVMSVTGTADVTTGAINNSGGHAAATTVLVVDGFTGALATGQWLKIAGDNIPQRITAHTESTGNTTGITITPGLKTAVADNAVVTVYDTCAVNLAAGYASGWEKAIEIDGASPVLQVGQAIQFVAGGAIYGIISKPTSTSVMLDRPLEAAVVDNAVIYVLPTGTYNFAFLRNAMTFVSRPMAIPRANSGASGAIASFDNISIRVVWSYDIDLQGMKVVVDLLFGVQVLDTNLGMVMLG